MGTWDVGMDVWDVVIGAVGHSVLGEVRIV